jgi:hypothetical protein
MRRYSTFLRLLDKDPAWVWWIRWAKRRPEAFGTYPERLLRAAPAGPERVEDFIGVERPCRLL